MVVSGRLPILGHLINGFKHVFSKALRSWLSRFAFPDGDRNAVATPKGNNYENRPPFHLH